MNSFKYKAIFLMCLFVFQANKIFSVDLSSLQEPYSQLTELLPFNNHGWYLNGECIKQLFKHNKISRVIEVGSWLGLSTRHIASLLPEGGYLFAVDTWKGSEEHETNIAWKILLPKLYEQFLSNVIHAKLIDKIIPVRMTSLQAAEFLKSECGKIDLIYIDAAHDTKSVFEDLNAYYSYVEGNSGILCGDDWLCDDVKEAVRMFAKNNSLTIFYEYNFWFLKDNSLKKSDSVWQVL